MIFSMGFIGLGVMIIAWPIYTLAMREIHRGQVFIPEYSVIAPALLIVLALTIITVAVALRIGIKRLEQLTE